MITIYITLLCLAFLYLYWLIPEKFRLALILLGNTVVLAWLGLATLSVYIFALTLVGVSSPIVARIDKRTQRYRRRLWLVLVAVLLLTPLVYFRLNTTIDQFDVQPIALSYFTLMLFGYFLEVYRGTIRPNFDLSLVGFSSFFPITSMGPIERHGRLAPQFQQPRVWNSMRACDGVFLIALGAFKKTVIADRLASFIGDPNAPFLSYTGPDLWLYCIFALIQLYCDFSGWIDIARGFSKLLGFDLIDNFNQPYFARSVPDIWRRWHISLVDWLRDFVYTPIALRTKNLHLATFTVMLLVGLWHAFKWNSFVWAIYWSLLYSLAIIFRQRGWSVRLPTPVKIFGVFLLMSASTIPLVARSFTELWRLMFGLFSWQSAPHGILDGAHITKMDSTIVVAGFAVVIGLETLQRSTRSKALYLVLAAFVFLATMAFATGTSRAFIYLKY